MKTMCIPKGRTAAYDTLETDRLVVNGCLKVAHALKAKTISGSGVIFAGTLSADGIRAREIEAAAVYCLRLSAKRVQAAEVCVLPSAAWTRRRFLRDYPLFARAVCTVPVRRIWLFCR